MAKEHTPFIEYTIKIKDEKTTLLEKFTTYEEFWLSTKNKQLMEVIERMMTDFTKSYAEETEAPEIIVTGKMIVQT